MAGKLHRAYRTAVLDGGGLVVAPGDRRARAYAEGYEAYRAGIAAIDGPYEPTEDSSSQFTAWHQGWIDGSRGYPPSHVAGPQATALPPEPDPEPDPEPEPEPEPDPETPEETVTATAKRTTKK